MLKKIVTAHLMAVSLLVGKKDSELRKFREDCRSAYSNSKTYILQPISHHEGAVLNALALCFPETKQDI